MMTRLSGIRPHPEHLAALRSAQARAGYILKSQGKTAEAIERAKRPWPRRRMTQPSMVCCRSLRGRRKLAEAEATLKEGLAAAPKSIDLRYRLGMIYDRRDTPTRRP